MGKSLMKPYQAKEQPYADEVLDKNTFSDELYPHGSYDIIDYFVRECIKREQTIHKNCGRSFAVSGRLNAEPCDRP